MKALFFIKLIFKRKESKNDYQIKQGNQIRFPWQILLKKVCLLNNASFIINNSPAANKSFCIITIIKITDFYSMRGCV